MKMSIRKQTFLATFVALSALILVVFLITNEITDNIASRWTQQYASREVTHAVRRTVDPIRSDLAIIGEIAENEKIIAWANSSDDADLRSDGLQYLNNSRFRLNSSSYFIALKGNGHYFYNDMDGNFTGSEYQYELVREQEEDKWFYSTLAGNARVNLNVNFDRGLGVTNLWINRQIRKGGDVLGIVGTGFEIDEFLVKNLYDDDSRFENLFIDKDGAIQLANDRDLIVNAAISIAENEKSLIFDYLTRQEDKDALRSALEKSEDLRIVNVDWFGKNVLLSITYIPDLEWYSLTAIDASTVLNRSDFNQLFIALGAFSFCFAAGILAAVLWYVERPIQQITRSVDIMSNPRAGKRKAAFLPLEYRNLLDRIERFAYFDPLTGLFNRRGLAERFHNINLFQKERFSFASLTVLDLDHFKAFNDTHGHVLGDQVLISFSEKIIDVFNRETDIVARIGGEEFVILTFSLNKHECAARLECFLDILCTSSLCKDKSGNELFITASAGIVTTELITLTESRLENIIEKSDKNLYIAKAKRNCAKWSYLDNIV